MSRLDQVERDAASPARRFQRQNRSFGTSGTILRSSPGVAACSQPGTRQRAVSLARPIFRGLAMQVDKIHEVQKHLEVGEAGALAGFSPKKVAVINVRFTRLVAFLVVSLALFACAAVCVLAIWEYLAPDYAWRALGSFGIISGVSAIFVSLNEGFGPLVRG
jgi:hypothetical protein